ncbi:unnamed protein product [Cylicocyclus nassatus]|uniref:glucuronosyltransferase n=1 Tax=Cylicocyclus nassatus TaxID=53992 RepID=A0AA36MC54_CYLNA|nr:unnamed protein product [Cylicocyclus nassatus]
MWEVPECTDVCVSWSDLDLMAQKSLDYCKEILEDFELLNSLKESKFELAYTETLDLCAPCIIENLDIKNVVILSATVAMPRFYKVAGLRQLPSFVPGPITPYADEMTFTERLRNFVFNIQFDYYTMKWDHRFSQLFSKKYPGFPAPHEIYMEKTALMMINVHEFFETPRPTTNMIKYIGGFALTQTKLLTKELDDLLNIRNMTVLFSMGSVARSVDMPEWLKKAVLETFDSFPDVTFIWKYEGGDIAFESHPNIFPMKWIPQIDLLADKRLSLFVTHGGMNSLLEATYHGKPLIVVPLFGDQYYNAKLVQKSGIATVIEKNQLNRHTLTEAIREMLSTRKFAKESAFIASMLEGRSEQYRKDIAKSAKIIIEHGRLDHLILHARNLNFLQYYCLDVIGFIATVLVAIIYLIFLLVRMIYKLIIPKLKRD